MNAIPPRIHILLASSSPQAILIRRGPSRYCCTIGWDRSTDTFKVAQWIRGRIYERRCDISPDGKHFLYFVLNGRWDSETAGSFTAISRAPYVKALSLYPKGDAWNGGGLFLSSTSFWLNGSHRNLHDRAPLTFDDTYAPFPPFGGECPGVYYHRLMRDGWIMDGKERQDKGSRYYIFSKQLSDQWTLYKKTFETSKPPPGKGCYYDAHYLMNEQQDRLVERDSWEWADIDDRRLVWISKGCLFTCALDNLGTFQEELLYDARDLTYARMKAPY